MHSAGLTRVDAPTQRPRLVEGVSAGGVDSVAVAGNGAVSGDGDLLGARGGEAGGVTAAEVVRLDGVVPVGLDGGIAVVGPLQKCAKIDILRKFLEKTKSLNLVAVDGAVDACGEVRRLIVGEPLLVNVVSIDVGST